jgi:EAL domain-containing protein (putative c-di-GMP-specific phosphodiesterase class I)
MDSMSSVAEGVVTHEQIELLRSHKCDRMQGYLFSRAVDLEEFERKWHGAKRAAIR